MRREDRERYGLSDLVVDICDSFVGLNRYPPAQYIRAQEAFEKQLGVTGLERKKDLEEALQDCWYQYATDSEKGWHSGGMSTLENIERILGCELKIHHNHCCRLGLRYEVKQNEIDDV